MRDFVVYAALALLGGTAFLALHRWKLGIINEAGLRIGAALAAALMALMALKSLIES